jgi:hypothetical protein
MLYLVEVTDISCHLQSPFLFEELVAKYGLVDSFSFELWEPCEMLLGGLCDCAR